MSERQIAELVGALVRHQHHFGAMSTNDRQWVIQNPKAAISLFASAVENRKKLLEFVASFKVTDEKEFIAKEKFAVDVSESARLRISALGDTFRRVMLTKKEEDIAGAELKLFKLRIAWFNAEIIRELSGEEKPNENAEITLFEFSEALAHKQAVREREWVIGGYIRDAENVLWVVVGVLHVEGWYIDAYSIGHPGDPWGSGMEFVSR
jgi:hypothetical protein